ncbi:Non-capsid protein NS-1 [Araneus ventricosus]|uniref:Non-capsid protein NS-1 n=1 Tax=Araneus ventricosus TaxID=182803 RepID=A0A4Y2IS53_ARAVE|nr:Non-capsid protein NS-1 [Araneus ventricosus]
MNYGSLADFWQRAGVFVGDDSGRPGHSSGNMVENSGGESDAGHDEEQITSATTEVDQKLEDLVSRFVSRLEEKNWKDSGYYISDVYACESPERAAGVARRLAARAESFGRGLIGISLHGDHVHSIHSCPYTSRSCRCKFKDFPEAKQDIRRLLRKPRALETFKRQDWYNITKYFFTNGREAIFCKLSGTVQRIPLEITALSKSRISSNDGERGQTHASLEDCSDPLQCNSGQDFQDIPGHAESTRSRKRRHAVKAGGTDGIGGTTGVVYNLLSKYAICPLTEIVYTKDYLSNPEIACKRLDCKEVKDAIDTRASVINTWRRQDYIDFYNSLDTVKIWSCRHVDDFDNYYYNYDESCRIARELLTYQCGDNVNIFCTDLVNVLEYRIPKRNTFVVVSPPSSGKNYLFDAVRDYYLNSGQMNNPNKYNQFAYQDCHNRRIIIWNEPNFEQREIENLKMLMAGDNLSANVKCKPQANVKRTPVIVLSNSEPSFCRNGAFNDRIFRYYWNSAPFLREYNKKPRPDAVVDVIFSFIQ